MDLLIGLFTPSTTGVTILLVSGVVFIGCVMLYEWWNDV